MSRLTVAAIAGIVEIVEGMHYAIVRLPGWPPVKSARPRTTGVTGFVYRSILSIVHAVGHALDRLLAPLEPVLAEHSNWPGREPLLAALNGVLGDYLAESDNPLAITMRLRRGGLPLPMERTALAAAMPKATGKVVVLLHGLCLNDLAWQRNGHDHGAALERDLGYTPVYLHYNTGLHVSANGQSFAQLLERLLRIWPVPITQLVLIGHSMGGLVARSACYSAARAHHGWLSRLDTIVFLGSPHHGAPLERGGHWVDMLLGSNAYSAPLARLGKVRSAGITDLRFGNVTEKDWHRQARVGSTADHRTPVPLPVGVACYNIAATTGSKAGDLSDRLIGDGIVPLSSALGRHPDARLALTFDASRQWVACGLNHLDLLSHPAVYARLRRWLAPTAATGRSHRVASSSVAP